MIPRTVSSISTFARSQAFRRNWPVVLDLFVAGVGLVCFYGVVRLAGFWLGHAQPQIQISLSPRALPRYMAASIVRMALAYLLSLVFAVGYGYVAAYSRRLETLMLAALDILQSIPVLSFLPGVMLAMVTLFPSRQIGIELGAILLIFTGQVWNIAFSFYSSLKSLPKELQDVATISGYSRWQRLWQLELPFAAIGLIWNSMVSVAGGWFFLMACEMFVLGSRDFRLPGLGSYLQTAASAGNDSAMTWGILAMLGIIIVTDQLIWRPIIEWGERFRMDGDAATTTTRSPILSAIRHSRALNLLHTRTLLPAQERLYRSFSTKRSTHQEYDRLRKEPSAVVRGAVYVLMFAVVAFGVSRALHLMHNVTIQQVGIILLEAGATFLRVTAALCIASLWTIPAGVAIGLHPRLARFAQPFVQIAASVPATALFPVVLMALVRVGGGMGIGALALMLLGTQWYILFNVIAGAMAIPKDLLQVSHLFRFGLIQRWKTVILPGIFPYLITGMVTASGGAWNASIVAEYFHLQNHTLTVFGLGAQISSATDRGQFPILLLSTIVMALLVVTINRLLWRPLYRLAETKYRLGN